MNSISFKINQELYTISEGEVSSDVSLLDYLRKWAELRGTKYMCQEGGCGACIVAVVKKTGEQPQAVNSCLVSATSCKDWEITTIEGLGNKLKGYNQIQQTLAAYNGSQCGYCSPAWVMTMYSILKSNPSITKLEIENAFSSNICRCTGYRPILDAFKSLAEENNGNRIEDIEDLSICKKDGRKCRKDTCNSDDWCFVNQHDLNGEIKDTLQIRLKDNKIWYRVNSLQQILNTFKAINGESYMLVHGNTAKGAYHIDEYPEILIDISNVDELKGSSIDQNLILGAGNTIAETITILREKALEEGFAYLEKVVKHLELVASTAVRNLGTLGGNLMIKHQHNEFQSDIFMIVETIGGMLTIVNRDGVRETVTLEDFLNNDMYEKVILNILLPPFSNEHKLVLFKVMPRAQNAIARVNGGFLYRLQNNKTIINASIVLGGISASFIHASGTENFLKDKFLFDNNTLQGALKVLEKEIIVKGQYEMKTKSIKQIALGLFYKSILQLCPKDKLDPKYESGGIVLFSKRGISRGTQVYDIDNSQSPVYQPLPKVEALIQCAGEAPYTDDIARIPKEVFAAFVLSTVPMGEIVNIDTTLALATDGVIAFYTAKDIPGSNSFTPTDTLFNTAPEEVFCEGKVKYYNQAVGIIVATTEYIANKAAKLIKITYKNIKKPILNIESAKNDSSRTTLFKSQKATDSGNDVFKVIKSKNYIFEQYQFCMEKQVCVTQPIEDGIEINSSSQWFDMIQIAVSRALKINENNLNISVKRLGGSFGAKISRSTQVAVACSLVTYKLNLACRMILPLTTNMRVHGTRFPSSNDFEVGVNQSGQIQYLHYNFYDDNGYMINESIITSAVEVLKNCYDDSRWEINSYNVTTDTAKKSWVRAPGSLEAIAMTEYIMEQISYELSLDPIDVRVANLPKSAEDDTNETKLIIDQLKEKSDYISRKLLVASFNQQNRWKKRGLRFSQIKWPTIVASNFYNAISIYHGDASVAISHYGIEMGQGINTKVLQVCARTLGIPIDKIKVKATNNLINHNSIGTGGSIGSEIASIGVKKCCEIILKRLAPIKESQPTLSWEETISKAWSQGIELFASYNVVESDLEKYNIKGAALAEVEVDLLTGESQVLRVDILEDVGQSVNPYIDVGQIEGAFVMGQGFWTCEDIELDPGTGERITDRTWNYHVPQARDIPQDFRVYFKRNSYNNATAFGSKAVGEPPICMTICIAFAIREAITSSRKDSGIPCTLWYNIDGAHTIDRIVLAAETKIEEFLLY